MVGDYAKDKCAGTKLDEIVPASEVRSRNKDGTQPTVDV